MNVVPLVPEKAKRDGCGCPPWIVRCAHFDGDSLFLTDRKISAESAPYNLPFFLSLPRYLGGYNTLPRPYGRVGYYYEGDDEDAAIAAFHAAEERLLAESS